MKMSFRLRGSCPLPCPPSVATLFLAIFLVTAADVSTTRLFVAGQEGYHTYRIPSLAVTTNGTVLAFCEGRKKSASDTGEVDLLVKRSFDHGATWSQPRVIWHDTQNTCGNPCVVVDRDTGALWLLVTWNRGEDREPEIINQTSKDSRRVYWLSSFDQGETWSKPHEITSEVKRSDWTWYATGPGSGIQIEQGSHRGRLLIPCDHIEAGSKRYFSHVIYSDDHGRTWKLGGSSPRDQVNECEVVELAGGKLLMNMRNYDRARHNRQVCFSEDGGITWSGQGFDERLLEPVCQASVERCRWPQKDHSSLVAFCNPAHPKERKNLTVRTSYDDGESWPVSLILHEGPSAYSDLAVLATGDLGCLYEAGATNAYEAIWFARLPLQMLSR